MGAAAGAVLGDTGMYGDAGTALARSWDGVIAVLAAALIASLAGRRLGALGFVEAELSALALLGTVVAVRRRRGRARDGRHVDAAVERERRRIARDIHDSLAQDLAFIAARVRALERDPTASVRLDHLAIAATRALEHSRTTISTLTRPLDEPLDAALARNATEVAARHGGHAKLRLQAGVVVPPATRESLVMILREAVANAMRHGHAGSVDVSLSQQSWLRLRVTDDGRGFDAAARAARRDAGFGLQSMEERAQALGGGLVVRSAPGAGTTIEVALPCPAG
jgi:signal transduction histidine kinase